MARRGRRRTRTTRLAAALALVAGALGLTMHVALAQPHKAKPKPKAHAADAGAHPDEATGGGAGAEEAADGGAATSGGAAAGVGGGAGGAGGASGGPAGAGAGAGGGASGAAGAGGGAGAAGGGAARGSPLNPTAQEMPGGVPGASAAIDGGTVDYDALIGEIAQLRARVAAVADNLFHSRLAVAVETSGSHAKVARLSIALDDGVVYASPAGFRGDELTTVYAHAVAPGRHAVTVDLERRDDRNDGFRTSQRTRFVVEVVKDEELSLEIDVDDDSTMGGDFPGDKSGRYDLRVRAKAASHALKR